MSDVAGPGKAWITTLCCLPASANVDPCIEPAEYRIFFDHDYECRGHPACEVHARAVRGGDNRYGKLARLESLRADDRTVEVGTAEWVRIRARPDQSLGRNK